jgi:hypothetical protein
MDMPMLQATTTVEFARLKVLLRELELSMLRGDLDRMEALLAELDDFLDPSTMKS